MTIEVRVAARCTGGLRLISDIPSTRPLRLEGRNGIGKSVTIRLLALISGEQPYQADERSWLSLREHLGPTEIHLAGLTGDASSGSIRFTPERWPPRADPPEEWLGEVLIDERPATVADLSGMFTVVHLVGTERLGQTLEHQRDLFAGAARRISSRMEAMEEARAEVSELAQELARLSPASAEAETQRLRHLNDRFPVLKNELVTQRERLEELQQAQLYTAMLANDALVEQEAEIQKVQTALRTSEERVQRAEEELARLVGELQKGGETQRAIARLERKLTREMKKVDAVRRQLPPLEAEFGEAPFDAATLTYDSNSFALVLEAARSNVRQLKRQALKVSRTAAENDLFSDLRAVLQRAVEDGLEDAVLLLIDGRPLTVRVLLDELDPTETVGDFDEPNLRNEEARTGRLESLLALLEQEETAHREAAKVMDQLRELYSKSESENELQALTAAARDERDQALSQTTTLGRQLGQLRAATAGVSVPSMELTVMDLLRKHSVDGPSLDGAVQAAFDRCRELEGERDAIKSEIAELTDSRSARRVGRERFLRRTRDDGQLTWLVEAVSGAVSASDGRWTEASWAWAAEHLDAYTKTLSQLDRELVGLSAATTAPLNSSSNPLTGALSAVVESAARDMLSSEAIRAALFEGGDVKAVNLSDGTVTWVTPSGDTRTRPMSAFSSGQQAFGFVRAKLEEIRSVAAPNRMVFLDEFGAFIAADQRRPLAELLNRELSADLADEVIVILPLQADYEQELAQTTGALHKRFEDRASQIREADYFTEAFEA